MKWFAQNRQYSYNATWKNRIRASQLVKRRRVSVQVGEEGLIP